MKEQRILFKKCIRDIFRNLKQFLAIIFIVATSVTLFVGLEANTEEFEKRINTVFESSNMGDLYVTFNPDFNNTTEMDEDYKNLSSISEESMIDKRMNFTSLTLEGKKTNGLFYIDKPTVSTPYDLELDSSVIEDNEDNFFYIDEKMINSIALLTGKTPKIGDELNLSIPASQLDTLIEGINQDPEALNSLLLEKIEESDQSSLVKTFVKNTINESEPSMISNSLGDLTKELLIKDNEHDVNLKFTLTGIMKHPENIESSEFSTSNFVMSSILFASKIVERTKNNLNLDYVEYAIETLYKNGMKENYYNLYKALLTNETIYPDMIDKVNSKLDEEMAEPRNSNFITHFYNQYIIKLNDGLVLEEVDDKITQYFNNKEDNNLLIIQNKETLSSTMTVMNDLNQSRMLTFSFPIIFFIVAVLVVLTTIAQLLLKERTQIGTMKGLGISRRRIFLFYTTLIDIIVIIGVLLGFIIGPLLLPQVLNIKYGILYSLPQIGYSFPLISALVTLFGVVFVTSLLTYLLIRHELKLTPVESMRPASPNFKYKNKKGGKFKFPSLMMALRNIKVHLGKSIMVIVGVMGCTGLLICGFGIEDTIDYGKNVDLDNFLNGDLNINYSLNTAFNVNKEKLLTFNEIESVDEYGMGSVDLIQEKSIGNGQYYYISRKSALFGFDDQYQRKEGTVAVSKSYADKFDLKLNDEINIKVQNNEYNVKIDYIFYSFSTKGIFIYQEDELFKDLPQIAMSAQIKVKEGANTTELKEKLLNDDELFVESVLTKTETTDKIASYVSSINMMTNTIKVFAIVLAVIVLVNLAILNFNERIRDIATLRVLGFNIFEIAKSLIYETMILTFIGCIFGLLIGYPLEIMVLYANIVELVSYAYVIYPLSFVYSFLISLVTAFFVNLFISSKIKKVPMAESLKSVE